MFLSRGASQAAGRAPLGALAPRELSERHWPSLPLAATAAPAAPPSRRGRQRRSEDRRRPLAGGTTRPLAAAVATAIAATAVAASSSSMRPDSGASVEPSAAQVAAWAAAAAVAPAALPARGAFYDEYVDFFYAEDNEVCPFCCGQLGSGYCHAEPLEEDITVGQFLERYVTAPAVRAASVAAVAAGVVAGSQPAALALDAADGPVEQIAEKAVQTPVERVIEKVVQAQSVQKIVERRVDVPFEVKVRPEVRVPHPVQKVVERPEPYPVDKVAEVPQPYPVQKVVERPMAAPGTAIAGSQASALALDAAESRIDGKYFGAQPVAPADWATLQADPLQLWGPPEASWAAAVSALPANPLALTQPCGFPRGRGVEEVLTSPPSPPKDDFPPFSLPDLVGAVVQAEAEVRFLIQQHRAAWLELESSKLQCCLEATPRGPPKPRRAPAAPLQPPALPLLQGTASSLLAGPVAYLQDVALNGGALPQGDAGPPQKGPSGLPPHPTPNLISGQGRAESWEGAGFGNPPPSPPLKKTAGAGFNGSLPAAGCPNGGASRWLPPPPMAAVGEDHNFPVPDRQARAAAQCWEPRASTGLPQGASRSRRGRARARAPGDSDGGPRGFTGSKGDGGSCHRLPLTGAPPGAMGTPPHRWSGIQRVRAGHGSGQGSEGRWRGPVGLPREQRRRGYGGDPPLTGASSGAPGNPSRKGPAPPRRLHGRASWEVT